MELKMKAAKERKSVAAVIREKLADSDKIATQEEGKALVKRMEKFSKRIAAKSPHLNLTQTVIDARYQQ